LALFDAEEVLKQVKAGTYNFDGLGITADFITGGVFSLDGVHPTARGYALIANEMIKAINTQYVTSLSPVNGGDYVGVTLPK
jgi:lysophospholipase L1-like esterase